MIMYKVGRVVFDIVEMEGNQSVERLVPFVYNNAEEKEKSYYVYYCRDYNWMCMQTLFFCNNSIKVYKTEESYICVYMKNGRAYGAIEEFETHVNVYLLEGYKKQELHHYFLLDLLHLERALIKKQSFVLHCSYVTFNNEAVLFTAPSGGGKTTQAILWVNHKKARIVNGDKAIVGYEGGKWMAYGLPISGSTSDYLNETHRIRAIIILEKSPKNEIQQVNELGFSKIFSEVVMNIWDESFCEKAMDLVANACTEIPVYKYKCTKTEDAVDVLYNELYKEE